MGSLQWALSWLVVVAVGLAPMLVYWAVGVAGRAFRAGVGVRGLIITPPG
jgi:hypothetical protein